MIEAMPSNPSSIQAVVFDYGKVLSFEPTPDQWHRLAATAGRPLEEFRHDYWLYRDEYDRAGCGPVSYWQAVARRPLDADSLRRLIEYDNEQWTRVNPQMLALTRRLRVAGVKTAILSNMEFEMLAELRAKFAWLKEFAPLVFSCELRMVKPEIEIFRHTAALLGVEPGKILFLDDKARNIDGARCAGMQALLFDSPEKIAAVEELLRRQGITLPGAEEIATVMQARG